MSTTITTSLVTQINEAHSKCKAAGGEMLRFAMQAGELLAKVKESLPHGEFLTWVTTNCPDISVRTAQVYMKLHDRRDELKAQHVAHLPMRAAIKMLAKPKALVSSKTKCDEDQRFIPPPGQHVIVLDPAKDTVIVQITPSNHDGYYYVSRWRRDCCGVPGEVEGTKKPLRSDAAVGMARKWCADGIPMVSDDGIALGDATAPWDYNRLLYTSCEEWMRCGVLEVAS